jgi:hypothetical protein
MLAAVSRERATRAGVLGDSEVFIFARDVFRVHVTFDERGSHFRRGDGYELRSGKWVSLSGPLDAIEIHPSAHIRHTDRFNDWITLRTLGKAHNVRRGALMICLCVVPIALRLFGGLALGFQRRGPRGSKTGQLPRTEAKLKELSHDSAFRQENILLGLREWMLGPHRRCSRHAGVVAPPKFCSSYFQHCSE